MLRFEPWKIILIVLVSLAGLIYTAPNFFTEEQLADLPGWVPQRQIVLGLDLQGGSYLLLEVDTSAVQTERLENLSADVRTALRSRELEDGPIGYTGLGISQGEVVVRIRKPEDETRALAALKELATDVNANLFSGTVEQDLTITLGDGGKITLSPTEASRIERARSAVAQSIEIVRRRIDELGTTEPSIQRQGDNRIVIEVPGLDDPERLKALLGKTAKLAFRLVDQSMTAQQALATRVPQGAEILYMTEFDPPQPILVRKRVMVSGESLTDAQPGFDQNNQPIITFQFDTSGANKFGKVTSQNVGRPFAIVLDDEVISAPNIREPILGGRGQISGGYTVQTANDLAVLLRAGALPAPLNILEERTVGPGLGADSVAAGKIAAIIGFSAVIIYIVLSYGLFGMFANIALIVNIFLIAGTLSVLGATLTLPGIAGVVLTIGMAVDANVLIFERIREEIRNGKTPINSIQVGYDKALTTILDANITTFIAAAILFQLGSGPVRGFSVTLGVGIITSVFTAFVVTRLMVALWFRATRPKELVL
jgi:preprotein translocase subunit SecD